MAGREVLVEEGATFIARDQAVELVEPVAAALYIQGDKLEVQPTICTLGLLDLTL